MEIFKRIPGFARLGRFVLIGLSSLVFSNVHAIPALQIGPGLIGDWSYYDDQFDTEADTWVTSSSIFSLNAYANALGGNGAFAWDENDPTASSTRYAYLVVAATPDLGNVGDLFDLSVVNDGGVLSILTSGYGSPPVNDPNSLASHGIFDSYFEVYEFQFDGAVGTIGNTQPGETETGAGYTETFDITIASLAAGVLGVHFDLFSVTGDGRYDPNAPDDKKMVNRFAPFSHDGAYVVPVPAAFWLFGTALIGFIGISRRTRV